MELGKGKPSTVQVGARSFFSRTLEPSCKTWTREMPERKLWSFDRMRLIEEKLEQKKVKVY